MNGNGNVIDGALGMSYPDATNGGDAASVELHTFHPDPPMLAVTRAMLELQRLKWECTAANCGLDPAFFGTFLANCSALPAAEQLLVVRELIDQLRHQQQMQASGSASAASVVLLPVSPLSRPPVAMSVA
jgi:hypothetical protein